MSAPSSNTCVGVDVSQDSLAVCRVSAAEVVTVPNASAGVRAWLAGLPVGAHLVCEATGLHHRLLQAECARKKLPLTCLNPALARDFALSLGKFEKIDRIDADLPSAWTRPSLVPHHAGLSRLADAQPPLCPLLSNRPPSPKNESKIVAPPVAYERSLARPRPIRVRGEAPPTVWSQFTR